MFNTPSTRPQALAALREITRALSTAWDLDTTLDLIVRKTTEVMHVDSCTIYLLDPDGTTLRLRASTGLANRALGRSTLALGEGMTGFAVQSNQPVFARDAQHDPHFKWVDEAEESPFISLLAVPLDIEAKAIGAMNVQTRTPHDFSADEVALLSLIGDLAAGTLAKAQLYDKQRRQIEEMRALAQVSEVVTSPQYLDDILDVVTEMAAKMMDTAVCAIFLLNDAGTHLELRSARRDQTPYQHRPPLPATPNSVIGSVLHTGQPLYIANVQTDPRYRGQELARQEGLVSLLSVPLSVRDRVIGVFNCYSTELRQFNAEQQTLFATLANQTALAIENARLVTNTAVVREMHHRIKNNLQTVAMLMQLQLGDADRLDTRDVLQTNIHRIRSIAAVHEILSEKGFRLVDVKDVLERITQATAETMTHPGQALTIRVFGDALALPSKPATAIALVVNELVQNSLEHAFADRSADGQIEVSLGRSPDEIIIIVRDNGSGLPEQLDRGLGLEIVEALVQEDLNGRLKFNRPPQGGTEISLRLPRSLEQNP
ncbi:MAG: GAF domain-containing protein [Candidatus Promineifilaceae bacterium]|nr:GAF domain-containing protein [Anaerolineaceae bacterium]